MDPEQLKQAQNDLQEIIANLSSGDPAQIKSAQGKLQALGYDVSPDGQIGPKTSAAVGEFRKFVSDTAERGVRSQETQLDLQRTDPTNRALKMGTEALPYAVGAGVGYGTSRGLKKGFDTADKAMGEAADRLATSRRVSPEAAQDQLRKMQRGRTVRTAGQFLAPATFLGAAEATRDYIAPQFEDPGTREAINLLATGEQAAGITLGAKQMIDLLRRNNPIDPETEAALRSRVEPNRLLRNQPDAPQPSPTQAPRQVPSNAPSGPAMRHSDRLKQTVTAAGAKPGKTKTANVDAIKKNLTAQNMPDVAESLNLPRSANRSTILQRLREISKIGGRYVWPVTAGLVAYDAVTGDAEASNQPEIEAGTGNISDGGVTNADRMRGAVTGTAAGGAVYGGNRLLQALPQSVKTAFGAGAPMLAPQMGADMTDYTPEETNQMRNWTARNMPAVSQFVGGYPEEAYDMAQVPEKNPARVYENAYRPGGQPGTHTMPDGSPMADSAMQGQPEQQPENFEAQMAELQQLLMQVERQSAPQRRPMPQMPAAPAMVPGQQNRLLQGAMAR
jgi:peptidoglycan hydrolase-like protein with peptidoglycan-binding domain